MSRPAGRPHRADSRRPPARPAGASTAPAPKPSGDGDQPDSPAASVPVATRLFAELLGTFWLVFTGCGAAVLAATASTAAGFPVGIGYLGVALAFGLAVLTAAYALGHLSGGHFNPAITLGMATAGRLPWREVPRYAAAQLVGGIAGATVLFVIAHGRAGFDASASGFATNGYGRFSPGGFSLGAAALCELVMTGAFVLVVLGATDTRAPRGFAPLSIGLALTLIHLVSIPVTNTSVNPVRSLAPALFAGGGHLAQVWLFILAPLVGAAVAGWGYSRLLSEPGDAAPLSAASAP